MATPTAARAQPEQPIAPRRGALWLALIPAILVIGISAALLHQRRAEQEMAELAALESVAPPPTIPKQACIEVYAVTVHKSEMYVRVSKSQPGAAPKRQPISTVVRAMARNTCRKKLVSARARMDVIDERGNRQSKSAKLGTLAVGQARQFELAWLGNVTPLDLPRR